MEWQQTSRQAQESVRESIPERWRLDDKTIATFQEKPIGAVTTANILTSDQLAIVSMDVSEIATQLRSETLSSYQVVEAFCAQAAVAHQLTNCLISFFPDEALEQAKLLDEQFQKTGNVTGPLHGIPVSIKDTYHVKGKPSTLGYAALYDNVAQDDAVLVQMLREAGAVIHCKTTMPQTGMALETMSNLWGRTLNPFNPLFGPGGSSGGDGALIAMRGAPVAPMTDIGGSIRVPAAFNGLYGIRPSADRIPKSGLHSWNPGQMSIRASCGPACHSIRDLKLVTPILNFGNRRPADPSCSPIPWVEEPMPQDKLHFAVLREDGVVKPHPPINRALADTVEKLREAGHHVTEMSLPFSAWDIANDTFKLYFPTGAAEAKALAAETGEPMLPVFQQYLEVFGVKELSVAKVFQLNRQLVANKQIFLQAWDSLADKHPSGRRVDALLCPSAPSLGIPHDYPIWWGYTSLWNYLDYPSTVFPLKSMKVDPKLDAKDSAYSPIEGASFFDQQNFDLYEPEMFAHSPFSLQIVARPFEDEKLLNVTEVVDSVVNRTL